MILLCIAESISDIEEDDMEEEDMEEENFVDAEQSFVAVDGKYC